MPQKVYMILQAILIIIGAGAIEGEWWFLSPICIILAGLCVRAGKLKKEK